MRITKTRRRQLAAWLYDHGALPPAAKGLKEIAALERRLFAKLQQAQAGVEAEVVRQLAARARIPSTSWGQRRLIRRVLDSMMGELPLILADGAMLASNIGRRDTLAQLESLGHAVLFDDLDPVALQRLHERVYTFSQDTLSRIEGDFAKHLGNAYRDGLGIDDAVKIIRDDFANLRHHRLATIARTEIQGAQNEGAAATMTEYGVAYKQWLTVDDDRVRGAEPQDRYDHIELHGQVVRIDEPFSNGLDHPGDRSGPIGEYINCRCRARPYIPAPDEMIVNTPYYP